MTAKKTIHGNNKPIRRTEIISTLVRALEPLDYVYAMWEGGAIGHGRLDQWSDIDLYIDAKNEMTQRVFSVVERALKSVSPIELKYDVPAPPSQAYTQAFYRLKGTSKFLLIDLAVFRHDSREKFLEAEIHGRISFCFNKNNSIKPVRLHREKLARNLKSRLRRLRTRFDAFECFVQKEINRENWIEALDIYRGLVLDSLVEALRIKHKPVHHEFKTRYIHYDLPADILRRLKDLYFVKNENDLERKYRIAEHWFHDAICDIDLKEIQRNLRRQVCSTSFTNSVRRKNQRRARPA